MLELFTFSFPSDEHRFWEDLRLVCPALSGNVQGKQRRTGTSDPQHFSSLLLEKICGSVEKYIGSPRHSGLVVNYISSMPKQFLQFFIVSKPPIFLARSHAVPTLIHLDPKANLMKVLAVVDCPTTIVQQVFTAESLHDCNITLLKACPKKQQASQIHTIIQMQGHCGAHFDH